MASAIDRLQSHHGTGAMYNNVRGRGGNWRCRLAVRLEAIGEEKLAVDKGKEKRDAKQEARRSRRDNGGGEKTYASVAAGGKPGPTEKARLPLPRYNLDRAHQPYP